MNKNHTVTAGKIFNTKNNLLTELDESFGVDLNSYTSSSSFVTFVFVERGVAFRVEFVPAFDDGSSTSS